MKTCKRCNESKDVSLFAKNKRYADGLWAYCKSCDCQRSAEYRAKNPEKVKDISARSKAKNPEKVAETRRKYRAANLEKCKANRKAAYYKNRDRELAKATEYKVKNKEFLAQKAKEWLAENAPINRFYRSERRAAEKQARPSWYDRPLVRDMYLKAEQKIKDTGIEWHVDHIVPLKSKLVCGLHWHENMQLLPASVNQSKSNRHWPDMP